MAQTLLFGDQIIETQRDSNSLGQAEAFPAKASASGTLTAFSVYVDGSSTAGQINVGLYSDASGKPGTLLTQGSLATGIKTGAFNTITTSPVAITSGTTYWIALLGLKSGTLQFRDRAHGPCTSQGSSQSNLTTLPTTWTPGSSYTDCPASIYGTGVTATTPILTVSTSTLSFSAVQGGANPNPANISITNTGSGTLTYGISSDASWLTASPASGSAPQTVQVSVNSSGLVANTYTGHLTISAVGAQNSPATVTVTLTVTTPPPPQPVLSVSPLTISVSAVQGGASPSPSTVNITNTGTGTLSYTTTSDAAWLTISPATGSAPTAAQVTSTLGTLSPATYTGHITVTAAGAANSPATITVTFTVTAPPPPSLVLDTQSLSFTGTQGGTDPAASTVHITNGGSGTLSFNAGSDSSWLTVAPTSGTAPQTLQIQAALAGLAVGTYTGHVTVTATGAQNSPATITATFTVNPPAPPPSPSANGDWLMINHDPARNGFAPDESAISTATAANLKRRWSLNVDGQVSAQPLYAGSIPIGTRTYDVLIIATSNNSVYAFDANSGDQIWKRNFGSQTANCVLGGGFGIFGAPVVDRTTNRIYVVSSNGSFRTISLLDGTDAAPALSLVANSDTNKVWGGLNKLGNNVYFATASDGCDSAPWRGEIYELDVSGASPLLTHNFVVVPGIAAPNGGGGIWSYGGVSIDASTGNVFATTADDSNEGSTLYAGRAIALDENLSIRGSYLAPEPNSFPCLSSPCDLDFASTPTLFQPNGCELMAVAGNKNGNLYLFKAADLLASGSPLQVLPLTGANDSLGNGGVGGVVSYWPQANMLFVTDRGSGVSGVNAGVVAMNVTNACTLQVAWSAALGGPDQPNSDAILANGVVFVGAGSDGRVHAYNALNGTELWNSAGTNGVSTYGGPTIARGKLYFGSWNGYGPTDGGSIYSFNPEPFPGPVLGGDQSVEAQPDFNPLGTAEAFQVKTTAAGKVGAIRLYVDGPSTSTQVFVGLYSDNSGHPGTLLSQADLNTVTAGAWATVTLPTVDVTASTTYWVAVLGTKSGNIAFRDRQNGACTSESAATTGLTQLPATWTSGATSNSCPLSAFLVGIAPSQPSLGVSPTSLTLSAPQGQNATGNLNVSNAGGGSLSYTTSSDSSWLTASPASGNAPQSLQVTANSSGLSQGTYTGNLTVSASGATGSPAKIPVTFTVTAPPPPYPVLSVSPSTLTFSGVQGGTNPASTTVAVGNTGTGTLNFTVGTDAAWLSAAPASGTAPLNVQVGASLTGLTAGTYTGHVTVTGAAGVQNSPLSVTVTLTVAATPPPAQLLFGDTTTESQRDSNSLGQAEAFQAKAVASGTLGTMSLYLDASSTVTKVTIGVYIDNGGHPGTLLSQASSTALTAGAWNTITVPAATISNGGNYWIAVLGTGSGSFYFRDRAHGTCASEGSSQTNLTTLPATWSTGSTYTDCPLSGYGKTSP